MMLFSYSHPGKVALMALVPSLAGLPNDPVIQILEMGLMAEAELNSLMHLIRSPDSHFLKVPELPFHVLVSVLIKFPADVDSQVFWSVALRDVLFDIMFFVIFSWNVAGIGRKLHL